MLGGQAFRHFVITETLRPYEFHVKQNLPLKPNQYFRFSLNSLNCMDLGVHKDSVKGYCFEDLASTFGQNFKRLQKRSGKTGREVHRLSGIGESLISEYRNDNAGLPEARTLLRLAVALECTVEELLAGIDGDYDRVRDLIRQGSDQHSGLPPHLGAQANDTTAAGLELQALRELVARYQKEAREVRTVADSLAAVALNLEEIRKAPGLKTNRGGRNRKVG